VLRRGTELSVRRAGIERAVRPSGRRLRDGVAGGHGDVLEQLAGPESPIIRYEADVYVRGTRRRRGCARST
jgi:hypothetical protein